MLRVQIRPCAPRDLDVLGIDALVLPLYAARVQPRGAAGFVDWRLSGRIARLLKLGRFSGTSGEVLLTTSLGRIGVERLFLFGLGAPEPRNRPTADAEVAQLVRVLTDAKVGEVALAPPEPPFGNVTPPRESFLSNWLAAPAWRAATLARLVLLDADGRLSEEAGSELARAAKGLAWEG